MKNQNKNCIVKISKNVNSVENKVQALLEEKSKDLIINIPPNSAFYSESNTKEKEWIVLFPSPNSVFPGVLKIVANDEKNSTDPIETDPIERQLFRQALEQPQWKPFSDLAENWLNWDLCPCCQHPLPGPTPDLNKELPRETKREKIADASIPCDHCRVDLKEWLYYYHQHY